MAQTISSYDAMLKELYGPGLVEELHESVAFLKLLEKDAGNVPFDGREWTFPIHIGRNSGIGAAAENTAMPTAGQQGYKAAKFGYTNQYGTIKVSAQTIEQSKTNKGAFAKAIESEMKYLRDQLRADMNFQFLRNGSGKRASLAAVTAATIVTLQTAVPYNILYEGMKVDVYDTTLGTQKYSGLTITQVALDYGTYTVTGITLSSAVTTVAGDVIVRSGNKNAEISGLDLVVGSGVYGGIDPTQGAASWAAPILNNPSSPGTPRPINYSLFQQAVDVSSRASGGVLKYFFTTREIRRNFFLYMTSEKRVMDSKNYQGGFDSVGYDGKEIFVDDMAVPNSMFGIDPSHLYILQTREGHWIDNDGRILRQSYDGTDSFFSQFRWFVNLACDRRNAQVKIGDIAQ